jgi:NAD+-dependent secondary alcohol dehydrogenase Adh1
MKAAVLTAYNVFETVDLPDPEIVGPTDVIVRISGAGVCGSDVHIAEGVLAKFIGDLKFPFVLGHENSGFVEAVGTSVVSLRPGDAVLLHPHISCGLCRACRRGQETFCENLRFPGVDGTPGGYAEFIKTDVRAAIRLPAGTDPAPLSPLTDAGLSAYHAVRKSVPSLPPDGTAVVIGIGGLGQFALQLLRLFSPARLVAVDTLAGRLDLARQLGADITLTSGDSAVDGVLDATDGRGADLVIDCVGVKTTPQIALGGLARGGRLTVLGAGDGEACCSTPAITGRELTIEGSLVGTLGELAELAEITLRGRLTATSTYYPLADAAKAVDDLREGRVAGRAVLRP